jgi:hypothetical protein
MSHDFFEHNIWLGWLVDRENLKKKFFWIISYSLAEAKTLHIQKMTS